jgi:NAD dependent epimerase/dehydratase
MKVFVTGADGFIGSHLAEALVRSGHDVRALVQYNSFNSKGWLDSLAPEMVSQIEIVLGDVRDRSQMSACVQGCDAVFHLAALIAIPYSYAAPQSYVDTNITGTLNILEAVRANNNTRMIHTSTSEVYGSAQFVPITEDHPLQGQSPYSASKIAADQLAFSYYSSFDLPVTIIRPFNTYGPRQSQRAVIPTIIAQLLAGAETIELGSTAPTRDFNFVKDTVHGFLAAMLPEKIFGQVINLGSGYEISVGDTAKVIAKIMKRNVEITSSHERIRPDASEVQRLFAANERARELLDWSPKYAGLDGFERGLEKTINWFSQPENLSRYSASGYVI